MVTYFAFALAGLVAIDDPPPAVKRYLEESSKQRTEQIDKLELQIKTKISDATKRKGLTPQQKKNQGDEINELKRSLESLKNGKTPVVPTINPSKFAVGQVGKIELDSSEPTTVTPLGGRARGTVSIGSGPTQLRVLSIVNANEMLIEPFWYQGRSPIESLGDPFWVKGIDTKSYTSKAKVSLDGVFHVSGTTSYNTQAGKLTVFVLEPLDVKPWIKK